MLTTKVTYALSFWIRDWIKTYKRNPSNEECYKYVVWKIGSNYKLSENDKIKIDAILIYNL